jgi:hypothetical protein
MTEHRWRDTAGHGAVSFVYGAAFPRLAYRLRWPTRLGPRGVVAYIAFDTAMQFALRAWVLPYFRRMADKRAQAEEALRRQLGRQPTEEELFAHLGIAGNR